jgi:hypothetical protein
VPKNEGCFIFGHLDQESELSNGSLFNSHTVAAGRHSQLAKMIAKYRPRCSALLQRYSTNVLF